MIWKQSQGGVGDKHLKRATQTKTLGGSCLTDSQASTKPKEPVVKKRKTRRGMSASAAAETQ